MAEEAFARIKALQNQYKGKPGGGSSGSSSAKSPFARGTSSSSFGSKFSWGKAGGAGGGSSVFGRRGATSFKAKFGGGGGGGGGGSGAMTSSSVAPLAPPSNRSLVEQWSIQDVGIWLGIVEDRLDSLAATFRSKGWSGSEVKQYTQELHGAFQVYKQSFMKRGINGAALLTLTDSDLQGLGVNNAYHRAQLVVTIQAIS